MWVFGGFDGHVVYDDVWVLDLAAAAYLPQVRSSLVTFQLGLALTTDCRLQVLVSLLSKRTPIGCIMVLLTTATTTRRGC